MHPNDNWDRIWDEWINKIDVPESIPSPNIPETDWDTIFESKYKSKPTFPDIATEKRKKPPRILVEDF